MNGVLEARSTGKGKAFSAWCSWVGLGLVLVLALFLRRHTFDLPHARGDQHHYVGLAHKLVHEGIGSYNLRGLALRKVAEDGTVRAFESVPGRGPVLEDMLRHGNQYYDVPLFQTPYGLPLALCLSHAVLRPAEPFELLVLSDAQLIREAGPGVGLRNHRFAPGIAQRQHYAVIVPLACSLALILLTFALGVVFFGSRSVGLVGAFLMAVSPIDLLASQKIWADDMTSVLALAAVLLHALARRRASWPLALAAGLACGASVITKHTGAFVIPAVLLIHVTMRPSGVGRPSSWLGFVDRELVAFVLGVAMLSGHWFFLMTSEYGNPIHLPSRAADPSASAWMQLVNSRPWYVYLLGIPYQNPFFAMAYLAPLAVLFDRGRALSVLTLCVWIGTFLLIFGTLFQEGGREHRYMLPAYPAYAVLAAYGADRLRLALAERTSAWVGSGLLLTALALSAAWSVPIGFDALFHNRPLIQRPW